MESPSLSSYLKGKNFLDNYSTMIVSVCPVGYDLVQSPRGRICYKISSTASTWDAADATCGSEGANLANFKFPAEYVSEFL